MEKTNKILKNIREGNFHDSIELIKEEMENGTTYDPLLNGLLGVSYFKIGDLEKSVLYLNKSINLGSKSELFFMSLYLSYFKLHEDEKAIEVLFNYISKYPPNLFMATLEELLEGLEKGYGTNYKEQIEFYCKKYGLIK